MRLTRLLFAAGTLFILASGAPIVGKAQPAKGSRATQSAWRKLCFDAQTAQSGTGSGSRTRPAAGEIVEACYTYVDIRHQPTGIRIGSLGVLQLQALNRTLLIALLPLRPAMTPEPGYLLFQDGTQVKLAFPPDRPCGVLGCYAGAELSESLLKRIEAARALSFGFEDVISGRPVSTPLACCGFAEAYAGAPANANARYDETTQFWIIKYLQRNLVDLLQ